MIPIVLFALAVPAMAASVKGIMGQMADTTKAAKAVLTSFDPAKADSVFTRYAQQGRAADALYAGRGDGQSRDLRARFERFASVAQASVGQSKDASTFGKHFAAIAAECRSCHAVYK